MNTTFGERLKAMMRSLHLTQLGLAVDLNITQPAVSAMATDLRDPKLVTLAKMCKLFLDRGASPDSICWLITGEGSAP